ncbi:MAG: aldo/keto reductase [Bryobacteraceae bacterium]|jgi:aryl-alcohol dehydrogenase-like predicted oxidoreductase
MDQRFLGKSGLSVSSLSLGTMTFGGKGRHAAMGGLGVEEARRLVDMAIDRGVTLFDTADIYSEGLAEEVLGAALKGRRHHVQIATKAFSRMGPGPNDLGLSRHHLMEACEASLRRLGADYIDLYQAHSMDSIAPMEETLEAFDTLVRQGKVRYIGCSNFSAWQTMKAVAISQRSGLPRYISQQIQYSLLVRDAEFELIPMGLDQGVGVMAWSPLVFGLLSGKIRRDAPQLPEGRLAALGAPIKVDWERLYRIVDVMLAVAAARGVTPAQVALNWVRGKPGVDTVILGARTEDQLRDNLASSAWDLSAEEMARLDEASAIPEPYPYWHQQTWAGARNPRVPSQRAPLR